MTKVGFCGAHGTGKTRIMLNLAAMLKNHNPCWDIQIITGVARSLKEPLNEKSSKMTQQKIFATQYLRELNAKGDIVLCDRTIVDSFVYSERLGFRDLVRYFDKFVILHWMTTYDHLVWVRPSGKPADDGVRDTDLEFQNNIDMLFEKYFNIHNTNRVESVGYDISVINKVFSDILKKEK